MPAVLPSLTAFDPETSSEGTLDPLGLYLIADQLATRLVPAVRERMQRIRFLTVMAVGAVLSEELEWKADESECEPWLVWEWLVVEALLRSPTIAPELRGVPGTLVTKRALARTEHRYLDERSYLKTPRIFGFHGVYKRLAIHLGLVDVHMNPQATAEELVQAWARDQGWGTRQEANQLFDVWRTGLRRSLEATPPRTHTYWNTEKWEQLAQSMRPDGAGKHEKKVLSRLLLNNDHRSLGALSDIWSLQEELDDDNYCEERVFAELKLRVPNLSTLLDAITAYEAFCRKLTDGFNLIRKHAVDADMRGLKVTELGGESSFVDAVADLSSAFESAYAALQSLDGRLANEFDERFRAFAEPMVSSETAVALCEHHEAIQRGKSDAGKRTWFDRLGEDRIYLRQQYRESIADPMPDRFVHDYRARPIRNFYKDLK
jgi:hypothetical protein